MPTYILQPFANVCSGNDPCQEFPGDWHLYIDTCRVSSYSTFELAFQSAKREFNIIKDMGDNSVVSIHWTCSDNDPRTGKSWFSDRHRHGRFDMFGTYIQSRKFHFPKSANET